MKPRLICKLVFFTFCICFTYAIVEPPIIDGSYHAISEISWLDEEGDNVVMVAEENLDAKTKKASFIIYDDSMNVTFYEDMNLNQTLKSDITGCRAFKTKEWTKIDGPPDIKIYEVSENKIVFPLMQLLWSLPKIRPKQGTDRTFESFRDVRAQKWSYQYNYTINKTVKHTVDIDAFWSEENSIGPSKEKVRPLGFAIRRTSLNVTTSKKSISSQMVNIFYFVQDIFYKEMLQPKQGVFCKNRVSEKNFYNFPKFDAISFNMEFTLPSFRIFKTVDMWIDNVNKFVQVNFDPDDQSVQPDQELQNRILIASNEQDIIYEIDPKNDEECKIIPIKEFPQDIQIFQDIKRLSQLDITHFFDLKKVKYTYIGEAKKRGIPCRLWQGVNRQQIPASVTITTLWEWCIAERVGKPIMYEQNALPVVSLDVTIIESSLTPAESMFTLGRKFTYNFYNMFYRTTSYINAVAFDITPCFPSDLIEPLKFEVHLSSNDKKILGNSTTDVDFIDAWRTAIYASASVHRSSMRITRVRTIINGLKLFVEFHLLGLHPDLPKEASDNVKLSEAKSSLEKFINTGSLTVVWSKNVTQPLILKAAKNSLSRQYEKTVVTKKPTTPVAETEPSIEIDTTTTFEITGDIVITETVKPTTSGVTPSSVSITNPRTDTISVTTPELPPTKMKSVLVGHSKGTMAGLCVGMLFVGIALGAGGTFTFTKYRYLIK